MKPTKRKGFNFLRSYFDVINEIPKDSDKLEFIMAIINKQFLDEDPKDLGFVAKLSYESQRHSIEQSVKGYKDKMKTDVLGNPIKDPSQGGSKRGKQAPWQQEKEKEKGKGKEQEKYNIPAFSDFLDYAKSKESKINEQGLKLKYDSWVENGWKDGNDRKIKNWKSKLLNTIPYLKKDEKPNPNKNMVF